MNGLFCITKAHNNEEYKKVLRTRMNWLVVVFILGGITLAVALLSRSIWKLTDNEYMLGVYSGVGTGLMAGSLVMWIKMRLIIKNEDKLKEERLKNSDERLIEINGIAFRIAAIVLLIALYLVGLIGGMYYHILVHVLLALASLFLFVYVIAYKILEKKS